MRDHDVAHAALTAASTTAKISSRDRCPVASSIPWSATTSSTCLQLGQHLAVPRPPPPPAARAIPRARRSCCSCAQAGSFAPGGGSVAARGLVRRASSVGSHTVRAPSRPAISTASGLSPPTDALSVMAPRHRTPSARDAADDLRALRGRGVVRLQAGSRPARAGEQRRSSATSSTRRGMTSGSTWMCVSKRRARARARARWGSGRRRRPWPSRLAPSALARPRRSRRAPSSPTRRSGRSVPLADEVQRGNRPVLVSARSSTTTVVSPPSGSVAVAMTVSEPPSAIARAAPSALRAA